MSSHEPASDRTEPAAEPPPASDDSPARLCLSSDGVSLGTIVGIHRDPDTNAAKWAVLSGGALRRPRLFVPLRGAVPRRDGLHLPYAACEVASAPPVMDHTSMRLVEEIRLLEHYGAGGETDPAPGPAGSGSVQHADGENTATVLEWRPYRRARVRRVIRSEEVTHVVTLRREELVIDEEPVGAVERLEAVFGLVERPRRAEVAMVLHREEVVLQKRVLAYQRVRVSTVEVGTSAPLETPVREDRGAAGCDAQLPPIAL